MTGIIHIGVTERGSFKKNILKRCICRSSEDVHNIKLQLTYPEFTVHMQNQLKAVMGYRITCNLSLIHVL